MSGWAIAGLAVGVVVAIILAVCGRWMWEMSAYVDQLEEQDWWGR